MKMTGRELYNKLLSHPESVTWADFFSDFYKKHSKTEMDSTISAGNPHEPKTEGIFSVSGKSPGCFIRC